MIEYGFSVYNAMFGNISKEMINSSVACMAQCTGCMCNCRCSCSGGIICDFEWEDI